ncbi:hypothetical protein BOTBODRAFT_48887, partial [Botryobasidium botryosum FD-172 SS1]
VNDIKSEVDSRIWGAQELACLKGKRSNVKLSHPREPAKPRYRPIAHPSRGQHRIPIQLIADGYLCVYYQEDDPLLIEDSDKWSNQGDIITTDNDTESDSEPPETKKKPAPKKTRAAPKPRKKAISKGESSKSGDQETADGGPERSPMRVSRSASPSEQGSPRTPIDTYDTPIHIVDGIPIDPALLDEDARFEANLDAAREGNILKQIEGASKQTSRKNMQK